MLIDLNQAELEELKECVRTWMVSNYGPDGLEGEELRQAVLRHHQPRQKAVESFLGEQSDWSREEAQEVVDRTIRLVTLHRKLDDSLTTGGAA